MKNPKTTALVILTFVIFAFTMGIFIGRNYAGSDLTLFIPEEIRLPPPTSNPEAVSVSEETGDSFPIDINTATLEALTSLPGIGEGLAKEILEYRKINGPFSHVEELMNVSGIGENRLESILSLITVGGSQ